MINRTALALSTVVAVVTSVLVLAPSAAAAALPTGRLASAT